MVNFFYLDTDPKKCAEYYCDKHVLKIPIEIAQILSKIHHELESGINFNIIYKNSLVVKNTLGPYLWAIESLDNYIWICNLGMELMNEYKFRYNKSSHKTENIIIALLNNPPKLPKIGITKFRGTNKFDMFQYISNDPIICARYNYSEMKCANDKWTNRNKPEWFIKLAKTISNKKNILIKKIDDQVRKRLPSLVEKGDKVYRFHSFLRVSYDHLFQGKWNVKAKLMNKFDSHKPLLYQLTYPQLFFVHKITKSLENKKTLNLLNIESLKYRKKLKFPNKNINYQTNKENYIYTTNTDGLNIITPYKDSLLKYKNSSNSKKNSNELYNLFLEYIKNNDLIGADMIRKFIQNEIKTKEYDRKWKLIQQNQRYIDWIESFNWKNKEPYNPNSFIL
jgi:hypothetical protein